ncbi:hypothetical protein [Flavobacterium undicola]|uniref:hypothetical protein n=1 Tax=Flavobacterium undicola TaxID=1932779 RepID=UPI00137760AF|nr:hypothetical protein [Flavobacterium undicola]MBA0884374.1 hypothetical protein [Flavobacterium undicola]
MKQYSKYAFYTIILTELLLLPVYFMINYMKWNFGKYRKKNIPLKIRKPVLGNFVKVCVHEWGGYKGKREKIIKNIKEFECGLDYQLSRFLKYKGKYDVDLTVTVSESSLMDKKIENVNVIEVSNVGMDFSGYERFYDRIKEIDNQYVILSNSSVNKLQKEFIDGYLDYFKENTSIGMMGISVNSKIYQSFIINNYNPHLQSFFLLTTIDVLREVVEVNGSFPGKGINHKLLLIRKGEVALSTIVLNLGYKLAVVLENGTPFLFDKSSFADNGKSSWNIDFGDYRINAINPNAINPIKNIYL